MVDGEGVMTGESLITYMDTEAHLTVSHMVYLVLFLFTFSDDEYKLIAETKPYRSDQKLFIRIPAATAQTEAALIGLLKLYESKR